jgi:hypothetical protein
MPMKLGVETLPAAGMSERCSRGSSHASAATDVSTTVGLTAVTASNRAHLSSVSQDLP